MLFMIVGYLRSGAEDQLIEFRNEFSEHLAQPSPNIAAIGVLRDRDGRRRGYMGFLETDSFDNAERFLKDSPFYQENLYERIDVFEYDVEVGKVG